MQRSGRCPGNGVDYNDRGFRTRTDTVASPRLMKFRPAEVGDRTLPWLTARRVAPTAGDYRPERRQDTDIRHGDRQLFAAPVEGFARAVSESTVITGEDWRMTVFMDNPQHPAASVRSNEKRKATA
jgi:hypothetical protein